MKNPIKTAWFGSNHPAVAEPCTECGATANAPCMSTAGLGGKHATIGTPITGLHAARIDALGK